MDNSYKLGLILLIVFLLAIIFSLILGSHNNYDDACKAAGYGVYISDLKACMDRDERLHFGSMDDNLKNSFTYGYKYKFIEDING